MNKLLLLATLAAALVVAPGITVKAQTQGPSMMGNDQNNASRRGDGGDDGMMRGGYGSGHMMGGSGHGPGMMGYGSADSTNGRGPGNRGNRQCWKETDSTRGYGYYAQCSN